MTIKDLVRLGFINLAALELREATIALHESDQLKADACLAHAREYIVSALIQESSR